MRTSDIPRAGGALLALGSLLPLAAAAQLELQPYAEARAYYDSNVYSFSGRDEALARNGDDQLSDRVMRSLAGLQADYGFSRQSLGLTAEGRRLIYDHFSKLDHNEHLLSLVYKGRYGEDVSSRLYASQERRMASFADRDTTALTLERERLGGGELSFAPGDDWRVDAGARVRRLLSPLPDFPDFTLSENSVTAGLRYVDGGPASLGLATEYLKGRFDGVPDQTRFEQYTAQFDARYEISGLTRMNGRLGYTRRNERNTARADVSTVTGSVGMQRNLSGVTSVELNAFRNVESYLIGAQSVIDTGVRAALNWQRSLITVSTGVQWHRSDFQIEPRREDRITQAFLHVNLAPRRWLDVQPFVDYRNRSSNIASERYHGVIAGLGLRVQFGATDIAR